MTLALYVLLLPNCNAGENITSLDDDTINSKTSKTYKSSIKKDNNFLYNKNNKNNKNNKVNEQSKLSLTNYILDKNSNLHKNIRTDKSYNIESAINNSKIYNIQKKI